MVGDVVGEFADAGGDLGGAFAAAAVEEGGQVMLNHADAGTGGHDDDGVVPGSAEEFPADGASFVPVAAVEGWLAAAGAFAGDHFIAEGAEDTRGVVGVLRPEDGHVAGHGEGDARHWRQR